MYMKVFPHGQGKGYGPVSSVINPHSPGREEHPPQVLRGSPLTTRQLIDSQGRKWKFTAGVLSWAPENHVSPDQEQLVMEAFESMAFAGLAREQYDILLVRYIHAGHHELHFVIPRVELVSVKAFNPCPPGW